MGSAVDGTAPAVGAAVPSDVKEDSTKLNRTHASLYTDRSTKSVSRRV